MGHVSVIPPPDIQYGRHRYLSPGEFDCAGSVLAGPLVTRVDDLTIARGHVPPAGQALTEVKAKHPLFVHDIKQGVVKADGQRSLTSGTLTFILFDRLPKC